MTVGARFWRRRFAGATRRRPARWWLTTRRRLPVRKLRFPGQQPAAGAFRSNTRWRDVATRAPCPAPGQYGGQPLAGAVDRALQPLVSWLRPCPVAGEGQGTSGGPTPPSIIVQLRFPGGARPASGSPFRAALIARLVEHVAAAPPSGRYSLGHPVVAVGVRVRCTSPWPKFPCRWLPSADGSALQHQSLSCSTTPSASEAHDEFDFGAVARVKVAVVRWKWPSGSPTWSNAGSRDDYLQRVGIGQPSRPAGKDQYAPEHEARSSPA